MLISNLTLLMTRSFRPAGRGRVPRRAKRPWWLLSSCDAVLLASLRAGDERAFARLVDELSPAMLRVARAYVTGDSSAEEVVQESWVEMLRGLDRFQGRSKLSTWLFGIVINVARAHGRREARSVPFSALTREDDAGPSVPPDRFLPADHDRLPGHWRIAPVPWPDQALETSEAQRVIRKTVAALPDTQRAVITLRHDRLLPRRGV